MLPMKFSIQATGSTMESRIAEVIAEYAGQGVHRTGTEVDNESANWLMQRIEALAREKRFETC